MTLDRCVHIKSFADIIQQSDDNVLQYNRDQDKLLVWEWYV